MTNTIKLALGIFVVISMAAMPIFWTFSKTYDSEQIRTFEPDEWKRSLASISQLNDPGCVRGGMAQNLINSRRLVGLTKPQVVVLLGNPEESHVRGWLYALGQCGLGWSLSFLAIAFDASEKVTSIEVD